MSQLMEKNAMTTAMRALGTALLVLASAGCDELDDALATRPDATKTCAKIRALPGNNENQYVRERCVTWINAQRPAYAACLAACAEEKDYGAYSGCSGVCAKPRSLTPP
jgi:hypothetical protein